MLKIALLHLKLNLHSVKCVKSPI
uniref:Uncharacterized protein n=1 Tax=Rhizophora mucronata TaxID=61149 RepID=A0A2P2N1E6_RHIMU